MAKFYGVIGYVTFEETVNDIWQEVKTERNYAGDVLKNTRRWSNGEHLNDNLVVNNRISIIADPYAYKNYNHIRFCRWMGTDWKVTNVTVEYPRLILDLGGVYNEQSRIEC